MKKSLYQHIYHTRCYWDTTQSVY